MRIYTEAAILKAGKYSDIFSNDEKEAKRQFYYYCKTYHPDADGSENARKIFDKLMQLYDRQKAAGVRETAINTVSFRSEDTHKGFEMVNPVIFDAGTCTIYHTNTKIAMSYREDFGKFHDRYVNAVHGIKYADRKMEDQFSLLFPEIIKDFREENRHNVLLINKTPDVLNLGVIVEAYRKEKKAFPEKHAAWIMNRLYNLAAYMEFYKQAFNRFSLCNLWVSPKFHTILLLGGWEYAEELGKPMAGCPKDVYKVLPLKIKESHVSCTLTDQEAIRQIGRELFKDSSCGHVQEFFDSGSEENGILHEWKDYGKALHEDLGKRAFVAWDNVPYA